MKIPKIAAAATLVALAAGCASMMAEPDRSAEALAKMSYPTRLRAKT